VHQIVFTEDRPARIDEGDQNVKRATAKLDRTSIGKQLSAAPEYLETAERHDLVSIAGGFRGSSFYQCLRPGGSP
jgi:hypothetical protein